MRVRATASGTAQSNAIGQVELTCTPAGLSVGLYGVGAYSEGYATGALTSGTRFTIPYGNIVAARCYGEQVYLELDAPSFPHNRLTLTRFTAGPGVPLLELSRRRLILQFTALSAAAIATLAGSMLAPTSESQSLAWGALGYGALAGTIVLALGFSLDQSLFVRPPGEEATREAFLSELSLHFPGVVRADAPPARKKERRLPNLSALLPRTTAMVGVTLAATILTALVTGQRLLTNEGDRSADRRTQTSPHDAPSGPIEAEPPTTDSPSRALEEQAVPTSAPSDGLVAEQDEPPSQDGATAVVERRCLCDRADSQLWKNPIPKLSGVLIERRALPRKSYMKTELEVAVVNNSDTPISEITLHVQFYEERGGKRVPTKERPLYFEGPLAPGEAIKWKTEARGTDFEIAVPDLGDLGPNGDGSAPAATFVELLKAANHRPVRLHAARILSFLGDERARAGALELKDAMRAAEAPFLRRILAATGDTRICDIEVRKEGPGDVGACVYNATSRELDGLGIQLNDLAGALDVDHPLADPPSLRAQMKWKVPDKVQAQSGRYVRVPLPAGFLTEKDSSLEVTADRFDLLD